jgi:hypothetical protein
VVATLLDGGTGDQAISQEAQGVRAQKAAASDGTANRELDTTATMEEPVSSSVPNLSVAMYFDYCRAAVSNYCPW